MTFRKLEIKSIFDFLSKKSPNKVICIQSPYSGFEGPSTEGVYGVIVEKDTYFLLYEKTKYDHTSDRDSMFDVDVFYKDEKDKKYKRLVSYIEDGATFSEQEEAEAEEYFKSLEYDNISIDRLVKSTSLKENSFGLSRQLTDKELLKLLDESISSSISFKDTLLGIIKDNDKTMDFLRENLYLNLHDIEDVDNLELECSSK
jgi:hypothetical protein